MWLIIKIYNSLGSPMIALKNIMNVCDFLTWSKEHKGHLGLMINSFIIVSLYEGYNSPSYKIIH
jgi:hypothetical protein